MPKLQKKKGQAFHVWLATFARMYFFFCSSVQYERIRNRDETKRKRSVCEKRLSNARVRLESCQISWPVFFFFFIDGLRKEVNARGNEREWNANVCFLANCCVCAVHWYSWPWVPRQMSGSNDIGKILVRIVWLSSNLDLSCTNCCTLSIKSYFFFRVNGFLWSNIFLTIFSSVQ